MDPTTSLDRGDVMSKVNKAQGIREAQNDPHRLAHVYLRRRGMAGMSL